MTFEYLRGGFKRPQRHSVGQAINMAWCLAAGAGCTLVQAQEAVNAPAAAASAAPAALETVTVTARKRDELLLDVPISMQAYSEKALRAAGTYDLQDLKSTSGFTLNQGAGTSAGGRTLGNLSFRGLQGDSGFLPNEVSGGLFVDGIYVSTGVGSVNTIDVSRVEVLKGPQNAFFGRNTFGGAINFITKNPSSEFRSEGNATFNQRGSTDVDLSVEGPLIADMLNGRITVVSHNKAATYRASDGGDLGAEKTRSVSTTLYATPTDKLWIRLRGQYQQDDDSAAAVGYVPARGNTSCNGQFFGGKTADGTQKSFTPATGYFCGSIPKLSDVGGRVIDANTTIPAGAIPAFETNSLDDPVRAKTPSLDHTGMRRNITRASLQSGYELPSGASFEFNLGYNDSSSSSIWDLDHTTSTNYLNLLALATSDLTADARISSDPRQALRGLFGLSLFTQRYQFAQLNFNNYTTATRDPNNFIDNKSNVPAAYGSLEYDILKNLTVSADVRYQQDKITTKSFDGSAAYDNTAKNWLPRVALRFKPTPDMSVYGTVAQGVQQLTTNTGYINANPTVRAYILSQVPGTSEYTPQPKVTSYELGIKQSLMNNQLQYAVAIYDQKWKNRLTNTILLCTPGQENTPACPLTSSGTSVAVGNDVTIKGIELSLDGAVSKAWSFGAYVDYKSAKYDSDYNASLSAITGDKTIVRFDGNTVPRIPALSGAVNATWRTGLPGGWGGFVRGDLTYTGRAWDSDLNIVQTEAYFRTNLRLGVDKKDTTIEFFVKNLFNDKTWDYAHRVADLSGPYPGYFSQGFLVGSPPPREVGVRLHYAFN